MSWMFAVGCGNGDDDDDTVTDAGKDGTAPTLDATSPGDDDTNDAGGDATTTDASKLDSGADTGVVGTTDGGKDGSADAGDAGDAGEDAGTDAGVDSGVDAGVLPTFRLSGRWSTSGNASTASWPGSGILVSFTGATLELNVSDAANTASFPGGDYLEAWINGTKVAAPIAINANGATIITSTAPLTGTNTAEIRKATDANIGAITVTNYTTSAAGTHANTPFTTTTAGTIVPAASTFVHKIEFIGDEQTVGYGDVPVCNGASTGNLTTAQVDVTDAYPSIVSRVFNADYIATAEYQMGILGDSGGNTSKAASALWPLTVPDTTNTATWTPASFVPDVVVVNLGSITDQALEASTGFAANYEAGVVSFLTTVYNAYGKKPSFIILSGSEYSLSDTTAEETSFQGYASAAFTTFKTNTGAAGVVADLATYAGGCGYYPDGNAHAANATQIEGLLKAAPFSWTTP